jgi:hypothetical protein
MKKENIKENINNKKEKNNYKFLLSKIFLSDSDIAKIFGIPLVTIYRWKKDPKKRNLYLFLKNHKGPELYMYLNRKNCSSLKDVDISNLLGIHIQTISFWKFESKKNKTKKETWRRKLYDFIKKHSEKEIKDILSK